MVRGSAYVSQIPPSPWDQCRPPRVKVSPASPAQPIPQPCSPLSARTHCLLPPCSCLSQLCSVPHSRICSSGAGSLPLLRQPPDTSDRPSAWWLFKKCLWDEGVSLGKGGRAEPSIWAEWATHGQGVFSRAGSVWSVCMSVCEHVCECECMCVSVSTK